MGVIDRSKKMPGGRKSTDGPSVMSCLLWVSPGLQRASWRASGQVVQVIVGKHGHWCNCTPQVHRYNTLLRWLLSPGPSFYENSLVWGITDSAYGLEKEQFSEQGETVSQKGREIPGKPMDKETFTLKIRSKRLASQVAFVSSEKTFCSVL